MKRYDTSSNIAGCDEAGRGCLAGPVVAAAVILPPDFDIGQLRDSKKLTDGVRRDLRTQILSESLDYVVQFESPRAIETQNILWASIHAMQMAVLQLSIQPDLVLVDGNRFRPFENLPHECVVKGDDIYASIAAASILAKTFRDDYMESISSDFPVYQWSSNKGYPTKGHRQAIIDHGICWHHRKTFGPCRSLF